MTGKLLLIDGSSVLSRQYYGSLPNSVKFAKTTEEKEKAMKDVLQTKDGLPTNGIYAMMRFLLKIIRTNQPTHVAICWDVSRETFRKEKYSAYKGTRGQTPSALKKQFELAKKVFDYIGVAQFELNDYEADDIIGTLAKKFQSDLPVSILTGDQDALQLVNEQTTVWFTTSKAKEWYEKRGIDPKALALPDKIFEYTEKTVQENYGLRPKQITDLKALEGDTSDNIPGVRGVGPSAIVPLLQHYGTIEQLYKALETTPIDTLKVFFKETLGMTRSPLGSLLRRSNQAIASTIQVMLRQNFSSALVKEVDTLFKESEDKEIREEAKHVKTLKGISYKEHAYALSEKLAKIDAGLIGKQAAFLSKELATIVTTIPTYRRLSLDALRLQLNQLNMQKIFQRLEFHSLIH